MHPKKIEDVYADLDDVFRNCLCAHKVLGVLLLVKGAELVSLVLMCHDLHLTVLQFSSINININITVIRNWIFKVQISELHTF